jgi:Dimethyladenosine transferase (rRNA methylation)
MVAIEIDPMLIEHLKNRESLKGLNIVHGDVLLQDIESLPVKNLVRVIGNIPYNITSPIIFWLIEQLHFWDDAFIMMQKEVAERLSAVAGTKAYGRFTVVTGAYLNMEYCFTIPPDVLFQNQKWILLLSVLPKRKHQLFQMISMSDSINSSQLLFHKDGKC